MHEYIARIQKSLDKGLELTPGTFSINISHDLTCSMVNKKNGECDCDPRIVIRDQALGLFEILSNGDIKEVDNQCPSNSHWH